MEATGRRVLLLVALGFFVVHAWTLPRTLEDIDSINFALGVESFDVASHRPHPPGYPIYIALAKASTSAIGAILPSWNRDRRAAAGLAVWSVIAGALAAFVIARFWMAIGLTPVVAGLAALVAVTSPLFWFTAARPMTDTPGLVLGLLVQAWLIRGLGALRAGESTLPRQWIWAAFAAGLIVGVRSQTIWMTAPFLLWAAGELVARRRLSHLGVLVGAGVLGVLIWAIPLVWDTGGIGAYLTAVGRQSEQDFSGVQMLATTPTWKLLTLSLRRTFVDPWEAGSLGDAVLLLALAGAAWLAWRNRRALVFVLLAFVPYLIFHLVFHETVTIRYALPVVVAVAGLAVVGLSILGVRTAIAGAVAAAVVSLVVVQPRLAAYASPGAPVFLAFQDMQRALPAPPEPPLLRMHHQVWHGVQRVIDWYRPYWDVGPQPFPRDREWQIIVRHWTRGETRPVWFLTDLTRNDMKLFDPRATRLAGRYELQPSIRGLIGGTRLDGLSWWTIERPRWMLGAGWSLTPEIAGMTSKDASGPHQQPAEAFLLRDPAPLRVLIGGRYLAPPGTPAGVVTAVLDGRVLRTWTASAESPWFLNWIDLPEGVTSGAGPYGRLAVRVSAAGPGRPAPSVGLEQFDAAPIGESIFAFLGDWQEQEGHPETGRLWRWTSERSTLLVRNGGGDLRLTLEGESPLRYFDRAPVVVVKAGERELGRFSPAADFSEQIDIPSAALVASDGRLTIETDLTFVPGEREASPDRRRLGLRLFRVDIARR